MKMMSLGLCLTVLLCILQDILFPKCLNRDILAEYFKGWMHFTAVN